VADPADFVRAAARGAGGGAGGAGTWKSRLTLRQKIEVWRSVRRLMRECGYSWSARDWLAFTKSGRRAEG
jgi:hypothetical protein